jgi:U4/U6.U5 tri-snRNP component SNU23
LTRTKSLDLRNLGQTKRTDRSTLSQVRARIAKLREETKHKTTAANFDFKTRLTAVKDAERQEKEARKEDRKRKREERRKAEAGEQEVGGGDIEMEQMMGFGGFGGGKKKR